MQIGQTILVTEYLENGDLYKAINSQQGNRYHWYRMLTPDSKPLPNSGMARRVALDIARGLHFLHTRKIVHFVSVINSLQSICKLLTACIVSKSLHLLFELLWCI